MLFGVTMSAPMIGVQMVAYDKPEKFFYQLETCLTQRYLADACLSD
jgi:hypothetical protein